MNEEVDFPSSGVYFKNAGLVLLRPYFPMLFERLGLTKENVFINKDTQIKAVHYLQFLVSGQSQTEEHLIFLNKILCGLEPTTPVPDGIEITPGEEVLMNGLLEAAIAQWSILGSTSIEGYRVSFLNREGKLTEQGDFWELKVNQKAFDMLLDQLPYSYSPIKLPWMKKQMNVIWR